MVEQERGKLQVSFKSSRVCVSVRVRASHESGIRASAKGTKPKFSLVRVRIGMKVGVGVWDRVRARGREKAPVRVNSDSK